MRVREWCRPAACVIVLAALACVGCGPYLQNRANDAKDIIDLGLTVTSKPTLALHADFFNITPIGVSYIEGHFVGLGNRQFGVLRYDDAAWGAVVWGEEPLTIGEFDPENPHLLKPHALEQLKAQGKPLPTEAIAYPVGIARMASEGRNPPWPTFLSCRKNLHLGWIGIYNICRPIDLIDFVLGWTTLDIIGDDKATH